MNSLQKAFSKALVDTYYTKQVLNGYLDYTYFYFLNDDLKDTGLKLGIILNHQNMCFELWLMGSTKKTQVKYWDKFKDTLWNSETKMPQWYIVSVKLVTGPDFEDLNKLTELIIEEASVVSHDLQEVIKNIEESV